MFKMSTWLQLLAAVFYTYSVVNRFCGKADKINWSASVNSGTVFASVIAAMKWQQFDLLKLKTWTLGKNDKYSNKS